MQIAQLSTFTEENSYDLGRGGGRGNETDVFQVKIY